MKDTDDLTLPHALNRKNWRNGKPPKELHMELHGDGITDDTEALQQRVKLVRKGGGAIKPEVLARAMENDPREMFVKNRSTPKRDYSAPVNREIKPKRDAKTKAAPKAKAKPKGGRKK
jgi:hypothetical protein